MFSQMLNIYFFNNVHTTNVLVEFDFEPVKKTKKTESESHDIMRNFNMRYVYLWKFFISSITKLTLINSYNIEKK